MEKEKFIDQLLKWYSENKRDLPWRSTKDPYKIWLSEIILQQTRIMQGRPYYTRFLDSYNDIQAFARASETDILRIWQGLGYYSRARNMLKCAKLVVRKYQAVFPGDYQELLKLPGIGPYTAAAIASISFDRPVPVIDGNVYRVLSRIFGIQEDIQSSNGKKIFSKLAGELMPDKNGGDYNQAIMDFGAIMCTPQNPGCDRCSFSPDCFALRHERQAELPVNRKKNKNKIRYFHYLVIRYGEKVFMNKREKKDIWYGLFDFPLIESSRQKFDLTQNKLTHFLMKNHLINNQTHFKHILTHQRIHATFYLLSLDTLYDEVKVHLPETGRFYTNEEVEILPKPRLINKYLKEE